MQQPVARVAVDVPHPHLDRLFDYAVPEELDEAAQPGVRVKVRFAGRLVGGFVIGRVAASDHPGKLTALAKVVSPEPVLAPDVAVLARAVADRSAGTLADVLRLAVPPRHARVERELVVVGEPKYVGPAHGGAENGGADHGGAAVGRTGGGVAASPALTARPAGTSTPTPHPWSGYPAGGDFLDALAAGRSPRAIWEALPGPDWPGAIAAAVAATRASGRGALVVVPDARDLARVDAALTSVFGGPHCHAVLAADLGPAERYRRFLAVRRGQVRAVAGTRAAAFAPVADLGLVVVWDDGDDLHDEPRAPYVTARDVLVLRAHLAGAGALVGGCVPSVEAQALLDVGWARPLRAERSAVRAAAPRITASGTDADLARDPAARAARLPTVAFEAARRALRDGPVLVQVPRRGYQPALSCQDCRASARCRRCAGPLGRLRGGAVPACRWCGRPSVAEPCPNCGGVRLRAVVVGSRRTAEEIGRSFPGVPIRTSASDAVLAEVGPEPAVVVATPGAEPVADGGYAGVVLLDGWALLTRPGLRAGEETLRRWANAAALARPAPDGRVVVVADPDSPVVQALVRWQPAAFLAGEAADRATLGFPPATRLAAIDGAPAGVADVMSALVLPPDAEVLGPVPLADPRSEAAGEERERVLIRVPRTGGTALAAALKTALAVRSAAKASGPAGAPVRVELDPREPL